jgi:predicted aspartyl protease
VKSKVWGRARAKEVLLAVDTGSASTTISPYVIEEIGYGLRDGMRTTIVRSAVGSEHGYTLTVARFATLGFEVEDFVVHVFDLPSGYGIDGLIGLSFLRGFDYEVRSIAGKLRVAPAVADELSS